MWPKDTGWTSLILRYGHEELSAKKTYKNQARDVLRKVAIYDVLKTRLKIRCCK